MRTQMMTGAALMLLAAVAPAMAGQSTKAEREATRQLNLEAAQAARQSNAATAQAAPAAPTQAQPSNKTAAIDPAEKQFTNAAANLPADSPPAAAPTGKVETASAEPAGTVEPLAEVKNPPAKVGVANVKDSSGTIIGAVQRVEVTPQGQPTKVAVALLGKDEKMVVLDADKVTYDQGKNEIIAQASADQIRAKS